MSGGREWAELYLRALNLRVWTAVKDNYNYYFFLHDVSSRRLKDIYGNIFRFRVGNNNFQVVILK